MTNTHDIGLGIEYLSIAHVVTEKYTLWAIMMREMLPRVALSREAFEKNIGKGIEGVFK